MTDTASETTPGGNTMLENKLNDVKALKKGRELTGKEKSNVEYDVKRNFYLGELGWYLKENEVGGSKDKYIYDADGKKVEIVPGGGPVDINSKKRMLWFLESRYSRNPESFYEDKAKNESELETKLRKARNLISGDKLTSGEEAIFKKDYYFEKLKGRGYKFTVGDGGMWTNRKDVEIIKPDGIKITEIDKKGKSAFKINWMNGTPSQELLATLENEFNSKTPSVIVEPLPKTEPEILPPPPAKEAIPEPKEPVIIEGKVVTPLDNLKEAPKQSAKETLQSAIRVEAVKAMPTLRGNMEASETFIKAIRNPDLYAPSGELMRQGREPRKLMKSGLGFQVVENVEAGYFDAQSIVTNAQDRYGLPLAIFVRGNHARLIVRGPYNAPEGGRKIMVYDPMKTGFSEIKLSDDKNVLEIVSNNLSLELRKDPQYDLRDVFKGQDLTEVSNLLVDMKAFNYQKDLINCVPYSLFVGAMLNGLDPRETEFKEQGIQRFEEDFGVRIMKREEITGETIPQRIKIQPAEGAPAQSTALSPAGTQTVETLESTVSVNNAEELDETEQWFKKVKSASVYNNYPGIRGGFTAIGDKKTERILQRIRNGDGRLMTYPNKNNCTVMSIVPLAASYTEGGLPLGVSSQDMAVYASYYVERVDEYGRSGYLEATAIMPKNDAKNFAQAVKENPQLVYSLIRKLNGGPIQMSKNAKIDFGTHVEILSEDRKNPEKNIKSKPFPAGYNPNPVEVMEASIKAPIEGEAEPPVADVSEGIDWGKIRQKLENSEQLKKVDIFSFAFTGELYSFLEKRGIDLWGDDYSMTRKDGTYHPNADIDAWKKALEIHDKEKLDKEIAGSVGGVKAVSSQALEVASIPAATETLESAIFTGKPEEELTEIEGARKTFRNSLDAWVKANYDYLEALGKDKPYVTAEENYRKANTAYENALVESKMTKEEFLATQLGKDLLSSNVDAIIIENKAEKTFQSGSGKDLSERKKVLGKAMDEAREALEQAKAKSASPVPASTPAETPPQSTPTESLNATTEQMDELGRQKNEILEKIKATGFVDPQERTYAEKFPFFWSTKIVNGDNGEPYSDETVKALEDFNNVDISNMPEEEKLKKYEEMNELLKKEYLERIINFS